MHITESDPRIAASFEGSHDGVRFTCAPHRYGSGMVLALHKEKPDGFKDRADWLAEALGGRWARGHQAGHRIARTRGLLWLKFYLAGWDAKTPFFGSPSTEIPWFWPPGSSEKLTFKQALKRLTQPAISDPLTARHGLNPPYLTP